MKIYRVTAKYPREEKYGLISDTRRAANSIIANIAETHGRFYFADKIRVLYQARGEVEEVRSHILVAKGLGYIPKEEADVLDNEYNGLAKGINAYIQNLKRKKT